MMLPNRPGTFYVNIMLKGSCSSGEIAKKTSFISDTSFSLFVKSANDIIRVFFHFNVGLRKGFFHKGADMLWTLADITYVMWHNFLWGHLHQEEFLRTMRCVTKNKQSWTLRTAEQTHELQKKQTEYLHSNV